MPLKENPTPKYFALLDHPFVIASITNYRPVSEYLSQIAQEAYQSKQKPIFSLTPQMAYQYGVNEYLRSMIHVVERLEQVPVFLRRFPNSNFYKENNISRHKWVSYHYTNFLIMSVSLYDIALLLTNEVFILDVEEKKCNKKSIAKNILVKNTGVKEVLDKLENLTDQFRIPRNLFVHRGEMPSLPSLEFFDSQLFIIESEDELGIKTSEDAPENPLSNPRVLNDLFRLERRNLISQIEQSTNKLVICLSKLFDELKTIYDSFSKNLEF